MLIVQITVQKYSAAFDGSFKTLQKENKLDGYQINAKCAIENSVIKVIEKDKPESTGENKLSFTGTCSSLLDILGTLEEDSVDRIFIYFRS